LALFANEPRWEDTNQAGIYLCLVGKAYIYIYITFTTSPQNIYFKDFFLIGYYKNLLFVCLNSLATELEIN